MPERRYASIVYIVAATLCSQFMAHVKLFPMINDSYLYINWIWGSVVVKALRY
jgi:hypothetical protein